MRKKYKCLMVMLLVAGFLSAGTDLLLDSGFDKAVITFVDVGQGDCIHIRTREGRNYLIDGGGSSDFDTGKKVLKPYLLKNNVREVDAAFVTHIHEDHFGGIRSLSELGMVKSIGVYEANRFNDEVRGIAADSKIVYLHAGQRIVLGEDVYLEVIFPGKRPDDEYKALMDEEDDENDSCLIFKLYYEGVTVLFTGDIDADGENRLITECGRHLQSDILKVPHHGSKHSSSEAFISAVNPAAAVIQVGKNLYGHPHPEVIERYKEYGCSVMRNDISGAIGLRMKKDGTVKVIKMID